MGVIAISGRGEPRTGVVERVAFGLDGCARELWVRCEGERRRVPATAVAGAETARTLDAEAFEAAPRV